MSASILKTEVLRGVRAGVAFVALVGPFAMLYGVVATEAGLTLAQVMGFSVLLVAGAAQFAALQQMLDTAPIIVVLAAAWTVNLRMAMYSAAIVPHLGGASLKQRLIMAYFLFDQSFAYSMLEFDRRPEMGLDARVSYFLGAAVPVAFGWYAGTVAGVVLGAQLPEALPLDFVLPIVFLSIVSPMIRTRAHGVAACVSAGAGVILVGLPWSTGLLIAAVLAASAGVLSEDRA